MSQYPNLDRNSTPLNPYIDPTKPQPSPTNLANPAYPAYNNNSPNYQMNQYPNNPPMNAPLNAPIGPAGQYNMPPGYNDPNNEHY